MEVQFTDSTLSAQRTVLWETGHSEQTQEIRLSDGMPDVKQVIACWGQSILRSKEWNSGFVGCSAGMMVWVLYAPEDGSEPRTVNVWIPFQLKWELPEGIPEGNLRIHCLTRFADARSVSPRKILVRAGLSAQVQACILEKTEVFHTEQSGPGVELLTRKYPLRLRKEMGEKTFNMDEELALPESAPELQEVIYCAMDLKTQETKVVSDKLVFRGNGNLHILYRSQDGQLHSWDFAVPFSQFALLDHSYGADAQGDLWFCLTNLEVEAEEGKVRLKAALVGQYTITDREMVEVTEDAYSLTWTLEQERETVMVPVLLDQKREMLYPEQTVPMDANVAVDVHFLPDFPQIRREENGVNLAWPGTFQLLCYGADGSLRGSVVRWEGQQRLNLSENAKLYPMPAMAEDRAVLGDGTVTVSADYPVELEAAAEQPISMVTSIKTGKAGIKDPARPSLILCRAGVRSLWELAKENGSTVDAIRRANRISEEPLGEQMLLIPVL